MGAVRLEIEVQAAKKVDDVANRQEFRAEGAQPLLLGPSIRSVGFGHGDNHASAVLRRALDSPVTPAPAADNRSAAGTPRCFVSTLMSLRPPERLGVRS